MSDETNGAMNEPEPTEAPAPVEAPASAPATPAVPVTAPASTDPAAPVEASAPAVVETDPMAEAMQQMPPIDQIDVPGGGDAEQRRSGRGSDRGGERGEGRGERGGGFGGDRGGRGGFGGGRDGGDRGERGGGFGGDRGGDRGGNGGGGKQEQVVTGTVVHIDNDGVLVDVGMKTEGLIRPNELSREPVANMEDIVKVGDKVDVLVLEERNDGTLLLSKKRADFEKAWDSVQDALKSGQPMQAVVSDRVKGGLVVDLGIRGFVPASHVGNGKLKNLDKFVGTTIPVKVLEVDRYNRKVVLSHRLATEEEREREKADTLSNLTEGKILMGTIRRVTDYGAFVDLGGIDGLLHVSEMSWTRVKHPSDIVKVGQEVQVQILKLGLDQGRVSLGMRQVQPDPWLDVANKFHVGDVVEGEVSRLVPFGAFVLLEGDIEGIVPNSELAHRRIMKASDVVEQGQQVQVKVIDVRPEDRRLTLSLRALQPREPADDFRPAPRAGGIPGAAPAPAPADEGTRRPEKRERRGGRGRGGDDEMGGDFRQFLARPDVGTGSGTGGGMTIGDMFGDLLAGRGSATGKGGRGEKRRGRRVEEDDDEDLSDISGDELDLDAATPDETEDTDDTNVK